MRTRLGRDERGFTLVELMVVLFIMSLILGATYKGLSEVQTATAGAQERMGNLDEARILMASVTKDLRTATRLTATGAPFLLADARRVTFYANLSTSGGPKKVDISVNTELRLVEEVVQPGGVAPNYTYTSAPTVRSIGNYVPASGALFAYFDEAGAALSTPLSSINLNRVHAIEVTLPIRKGTTASSQPTTLINRVRLPNLGYTPL